MRLAVRPPRAEDSHEKQWKWDAQRRALYNTKMPVAFQVVDVFDTVSGAWTHEGVVLLSGQIHLSVVAHENGRIGLIRIRREKVAPPSISDLFFEKNPSGILGIEHILGVEEYECPHGLALKSSEEVEEEMGLKPLEIRRIGYVNALPPNLAGSHVLTAVKVGDLPSGKRPDASEQIRKVEFFEPEEVRNVLKSTVCGLTKGALWTFRSWGLEQAAGSLWKNIAERL